jgi:hypothetical protein
MKIFYYSGAIIFIMTMVLFIAGCNGALPENMITIEATPSFHPVEDVYTVEPSPTDEPTRTPVITDQPESTPTVETRMPTSTFTPLPPTLTPTTNIPCNRASPGFPSIDVEIDDDTIMFPGQRFTKVWRLMNSGSCTWTPDYKAVWFFGARLGETISVLLRESVAPGESIDITVDMIAPQDAGTYQSNWKLQDEAGETFGIGPTGSSPFWVRIVVVHTPTPTFTPSPPPTATPTPTETPIPTPTPDVRLTATAELNSGDRIDLDTAQINPDSGADIEFTVDDTGSSWLLPISDALLGELGDSEPSLLGCQQAPFSSNSIGIDGLGLDIFTCFETNEGRFGWLKLKELNQETNKVVIELLVWEKIE